MDRASGHFRRYDKNKLSSEMKNVGFEIVKCNYIMKIGAFVYYYKGKIRKSNKLYFEGTQNNTSYIRCLLPIMKLFDKVCPLSFGLSVLCIAERQ